MPGLEVPSVFRSSDRSPTFAALPVLVGLFGLMMLTAPLRAAEQPLLRVGALLVPTGLLELLHAVRRADATAMRRGLTSGGLTLTMAFFVINAPFLAGAAIILFLAGSFALDALGYVAATRRAEDSRARVMSGLAALGNLLVVVLLLVFRHASAVWVVTVGMAVRTFGIAWTMAVTKVYDADDARQTAFDDLELGNHPEAAALRAEVAAEEAQRGAADRRLIVALLVILFAIHSARMQVDGSLLGYLAPAIALLGDMVLATLLTMAVVIIVAGFRGSTRWIERRVWRWYLSPDNERRWVKRAAAAWLKWRLRIGMRLRESRYSLPAALRRALVTGLPVAAIVAATIPIWGMSWFFDTENWASGIWNSWAESRTDEWRVAMIDAVAGSGGPTSATTFAVDPPNTSGDFSFIVIGDTGEGDASQNVLRDQLLKVAGHDDVRFVVISSDVVYPNGSMIDYENKFWLPFKGVEKPVYAIPGNHDWYDALEAFLATFLQPDAARASMEARANADLRLTSSTHDRINGLIDEAARLRREYRVPTGFQRGPFFEIQTDRFALLAIDTGIVKRIDDRQRAWLDAALERARGKFTMAVIGHPFYAGGADETEGNAPFAELKRLLVDRGASILMAGDTHDLEYYADPPSGGSHAVHYFVNGGGGAYLSFGTALQWPSSPPTSAWAYYPDRPAVVGKIEARTPGWKRPAWWWTTEFNAWPFSAEWLSGIFDYNVAPFFQSFVEVRVEPSAQRVRLIPYGIYGRLHWRELAHSPDLVPAGASAEDPAEWSVPMR